jgi:membrane associated rhomboid family serine protease
MRMGGGGGPSFTPLSKMVLSTLLGIYIVQLIGESMLGLPVKQTLAWHPFRGGFQPWQPFTAWFLNGDPLRTFFDWLFLFFLLPMVEEKYTRERLLRMATTTLIGTVLFAVVMVLLGVVPTQGIWYGPEPWLTALLVVVGFTRPNAVFYIMFVLPIRASWMAWGSGLMALLYLLYTRDMSSAMWLGGWICGYGFVNGGMPKGLKKWLLRRKAKKLEERLSTFDVIEGGGENTGKPKGWNPGGDDSIVH